MRTKRIVPLHQPTPPRESTSDWLWGFSLTILAVAGVVAALWFTGVITS